MRLPVSDTRTGAAERAATWSLRPRGIPEFGRATTCRAARRRARSSRRRPAAARGRRPGRHAEVVSKARCDRRPDEIERARRLSSSPTLDRDRASSSRPARARRVVRGERRPDHGDAHGFVCANGGVDARTWARKVLHRDPAAGRPGRVRDRIRARLGAFGVDVRSSSPTASGARGAGNRGRAIGVSACARSTIWRNADARARHEEHIRATADEIATARSWPWARSRGGRGVVRGQRLPAARAASPTF